jgi:hypothetical protein
MHLVVVYRGLLHRWKGALCVRIGVGPQGATAMTGDGNVAVVAYATRSARSEAKSRRPLEESIPRILD